MVAAFAVSAIAAAPPLFFRQAARMSAFFPQSVVQVVGIVWSVIVLLVGPAVTYAVARTVLDLESDL